MLTALRIGNFKQFDQVEIELGQRVVLIGPNNSGKTSALQALALWDLGLRRWRERRGTGTIPEKRPGITLNRRDLVALPTATINHLWRNLRIQRSGDQGKTERIHITISVSGVDQGQPDPAAAAWQFGLTFYYGNSESLYCRPMPESAEVELPQSRPMAYLPPMSGLTQSEARLERGAINVRLGEGRTAEVLRNLCAIVRDEQPAEWDWMVTRMQALFGITLHEPQRIDERGEIALSYTHRKVAFDISAAGRGLQQTLLLLSYLSAHPGAILLLDEPDAHLEILRQRQIYDELTGAASRLGGQIIAASHSEVLLNEAAERDLVISFVGRPHRINDRGSQTLKALREIGWEDYYRAETLGWVLYLEGATDLAFLSAFARILGHPLAGRLEQGFVHYVGNQPRQAQAHFHGLREAYPPLKGLALFDRLEREPPVDPMLPILCWQRREVESYLPLQPILLAYARSLRAEFPLLATLYEAEMTKALEEVVAAQRVLRRDAFGPDVKVTEEVLEPVFRNFFDGLGLPNLMSKTNFHELARFMTADQIDPEIVAALDRIEAFIGAAGPSDQPASE